MKTRLFLWNGQALYLGQGLASSFHQHHAVQIGISFEQPFHIRRHPSEPYQRQSSFLMRPDTPHQIDAATRSSLFLWIEAESDLARTLLQMPSVYASSEEEMSDVQAMIPLLKTLALETTTCERAEMLLAQTLSAFFKGNAAIPPLEERLHAVLGLLKQYALEASTFSPLQVATAVHLSPSRLRHLFTDQFGLSMQRYLLWQRLLLAIEYSTDGRTLTQAAHEAGFADAAHLTRTFRMTFGISPSEVLKDSHSVQVISCQH